jgi:type VI secretion system protein ImpH
MSAAYLRRILTGYFRVPIRVEQFVGKWCDLPHGQLTRPAQMNATLGATTLTGMRIWQRNMRIRLIVGPLSKRDYEDFLPGAGHALALKRLLMLLSGVTLEYEVLLVLRRADVGAACLGAGARLGWDAFLRTQDERRDRGELRYELHATGGQQPS